MAGLRVLAPVPEDGLFSDLTPKLVEDQVVLTGKVGGRQQTVGRLTLTDAEQHQIAQLLGARFVPPAPSPDPAPVQPPTPPIAVPGDGLVWAACGASGLAEEWASGDAFDVRGGAGTICSDIAWGASTRIALVTLGGRSCWKVTVRDGDRDAFSAGAQRTELGQGSPPRRMRDGVERRMFAGEHRFVGLALYLPAEFTSGDWCTVFQLKGEGGAGNGPLAIALWGGKLILEKSRGQEATLSGLNNVFQSGVLPRERWIDLVIEVMWSLGSDGFYALHGDLGDGQGFRTLKPRTEGWTLKRAVSGAPAIGARAGIYRSAIAGTHSIGVRMAVATTMEAARAAIVG